MFSRILIAVTNDELAERVIGTGSALAGALGARLALVHIVDLAAASAAAATPVDIGVAPTVIQEVVEAEEETGKALLDHLAAQFPRDRVETLLREGTPVEEAVAAAAEWGADLLVVGTHGRGGLQRLVLGSVAEGVLRHAHCPVLVVPKDAEAD